MLEELQSALTTYNQKWHTLVAARSNKAFFESLKPTAAGWKVADRAEYDRRYAELHDQSDQIVETWMNGRWVAKFHLRDRELEGGIQIIKLMQRRPGSTDKPGLDHVDFYGPDRQAMETTLRSEPDLQWSQESNAVIAGYSWLSVWFAGIEAKLKANTVLDIVQRELADLNKRIIGSTSTNE